MRHPALVRSLLTVALVALAGSGCDQILSALQQAEQQHEGTGTGTAGAPAPRGTGGSLGAGGSVGAGGKQGGAGASGAASGSGSCVAEMGATGVCKRCYDATGLLIFEDCPPPPRPPAPDAAVCISIDDGGATSCKDPATWQRYGAARCQEQNLVLSALTPTGKCDQGYSTVTYTCCTGTPDAAAPSPPPKCGQTTGADGSICKTCWDATGLVISNDCTPAPTGMDGSTGTGACVQINEGGASSCKDEATWKKYGTDWCAQQKLTLTKLELVTTCATGYSTVTYVCCGAGS